MIERKLMLEKTSELGRKLTSQEKSEIEKVLQWEK